MNSYSFPSWDLFNKNKEIVLALVTHAPLVNSPLENCFPLWDYLKTPLWFCTAQDWSPRATDKE